MTRLIYSLLLLLYSAQANSNTKEEDKEKIKQLSNQLTDLKGSDYIRKANQIAEFELQQNDFETSLYFFKKAYHYSQAHLPSNGSAIIAHEITGKILAISKNESMIEYAIKMLEVTVNNINNPSVLAKSHEHADALLKYALDKNRKKLKSIFEKTQKHYDEEIKKNNIISERLREIQKAKEDSLTLVNSKKELAHLSKELIENLKVINSMSREKLINEALLARNKQYIDSLTYGKIIDSITIQTKNSQIESQQTSLNLQKSQRNLFLALSSLLLISSLFIISVFYNTRKKNALLKEINSQIELEKERSEQLLLNILPKEIAEELKQTGKVKAKQYEEATIMFTDFINFSNIAVTLKPQELVNALDHCFGEFDRIIESYNVEKIKTIGDAYICIAGVPVPFKNHHESAINAGIEFLKFLKTWNHKRKQNNQIEFNIRIGIHSGPICAGVVGSKKYIFDVWGDAVNVAQRMETNALPNTINISETTYSRTKEKYNFVSRGEVLTKNMGALKMYLLEV